MIPDDFTTSGIPGEHEPLLTRPLGKVRLARRAVVSEVTGTDCSGQQHHENLTKLEASAKLNGSVLLRRLVLIGLLADQPKTPVQFIRSLPALSQVHVPTGNHVYFMRARNGFVKVGRSGDLKLRLRGINAGSPVPVDLIGIANGGMHAEKAAHLFLRGSRGHGEWFKPSLRMVWLFNFTQTRGWKPFGINYPLKGFERLHLELESLYSRSLTKISEAA